MTEPYEHLLPACTHILSDCFEDGTAATVTLSLHSTPLTLERTLDLYSAFARLTRAGATITAHPMTIREVREEHPLIWRLSRGDGDAQAAGSAIVPDETMERGIIVARSNLRTGSFGQRSSRSSNRGTNERSTTNIK